jgi:Domain of unknown function (DUF4276)
MKFLNIIVEGSAEEAFVNDVLVKHFAPKVFVSSRKIKTGWDRWENKPANGGLLKYSKFRNVQLHEFEAFVMVDPDRLIIMYPDNKNDIDRLKKDIGLTEPEEINESPQSAPSKRIIKYLSSYKGQKAQIGPLVAEDIGIAILRTRCKHFNEWITKLESDLSVRT